MEKTNFQKSSQIFLKADLIIGLLFLLNLSTQCFPKLYQKLQNIQLYQRFLALNVILVLASFSILTFLVPLAAYEARVRGKKEAKFYFIVAILRFILWLEILIRLSQRLGFAFSALRNTVLFASILIFEAIIVYKKTAE